MDAYIDALEVTIKEAARRQHRDRARRRGDDRAVAARRRRALRLAMGAAASAALAAAAVAVLPQGGKPSAAQAATLPVFSRASTDIAQTRELPADLSRGFDLAHARAFATSKGTGYVVASTDGRSVCMVIPDPPAGYGSTCAPLAEVQRRGLIGERVAPTPSAGRSEVIVVQPAAMPAPTLRDGDGKARTLDVRDGVATAIITRTGTLTVAGRDGQRTITVRPFEPQGEIVVDCGHGHFVKVRSFREGAADRRQALCAGR